LRFGGQSQHIWQISIKSERVGFKIVTFLVLNLNVEKVFALLSLFPHI